ncbi:MAG: hypothetical protein HY791_33025 [Deltaproteobacteria bacterium]|nr:hypothetical protein [Deltaproteobacteria bacterium]
MGAHRKFEEIRRWVSRLDLLDGSPLWTPTGITLLFGPQIANPDALVRTVLDEGSVSVQTLLACVRTTKPPIRIDARFLGAAQRDIQRFRLSEDAFDQLRSAGRIFKSRTTPDRAWLEDRQNRLDQITRLHQPEDGLEACLELLRAAYGAGRATATRRLLERTLAELTTSQRELERKFRSLLDGELNAANPLLRAAAEAIRAVPVRASRRAQRQAIAAIIAATKVEVDPDEVTRAVHGCSTKDEWLRVVIALFKKESQKAHPKPRDAQSVVLGLCFCLDPAIERESAQTPTPELTRVTLGTKMSLDRGRSIIEWLSREPPSRRSLSIDDAWMAHTHPSWERDQILDLLSSGLDRVTLEKALEVDRSVLSFGPEEAILAAEHAQWLMTLGPHFKRLGAKLELTATSFRKIHHLSERKVELHVLARVLLDLGRRGDLVASLDATLALFKRMPAGVDTLKAQLEGTAKGLGASTNPDFAAWLGDDPSLDRYLHLRRLLDEPVEIPKNVRVDFDAAARLGRELAFLASNATTEARRARLALLSAGSFELGPERTQSWIRSRIRSLESRALEVRLEALTQEAVFQACRIRIPKLDERWRGIARFLLTCDRNDSLLSELLRFAIANPGRPIESSRSQNQPWLEKAASKLNPKSAWALAFHRRFETSWRRDLRAQREYAWLAALGDEASGPNRKVSRLVKAQVEQRTPPAPELANAIRNSAELTGLSEPEHVLSRFVDRGTLFWRGHPQTEQDWVGTFCLPAQIRWSMMREAARRGTLVPAEIVTSSLILISTPDWVTLSQLIEREPLRGAVELAVAQVGQFGAAEHVARLRQVLGPRAGAVERALVRGILRLSMTDALDLMDSTENANRILDIAMELGPPKLIELYGETNDHLVGAMICRRLAALGPSEKAEVRDAVRRLAERESRTSLPIEWLHAACSNDEDLSSAVPQPNQAQLGADRRP